MKTENLYIGQVVKNYKEMCRILGQDVKSGKSKVLQLEDWRRYIEYHKEGNKIVIDVIYDDPIEKIDKRSDGNNSKYYTEFRVESEHKNSIGVYKIVFGNKIYIGSTMRSFRKRFQEHNSGRDKLMQHTYELLQQGGNFEILYDMTGIEDEELVRMVESEFIKEYLLNPEWNVINKKDYALTYSNYYKTKNKLIKVSDENYYEAIQLLVKHGLIDREGFEL